MHIFEVQKITTLLGSLLHY